MKTNVLKKIKLNNNPIYLLNRQCLNFDLGKIKTENIIKPLVNLGTGDVYI